MDSIQDELEEIETELSLVTQQVQELLDRQQDLEEKRNNLKALLDHHEQVEKSNKSWDGTDFPWTKDLEGKLFSEFRLNSLRPMQRQTMNATLSGEDCLLVMPTGGGKSLCFQLPAIVNTGLSLVVTPLVSLMEDQQMALESLGIPAAVLNASTDKTATKTIMDEMGNRNGKLRLLYVTPEKLAKSKRFMNKLEKCYEIGHLSRLVIDEVHCCSQWGHDFRPDYKFLGIMKRQFPNTPILGLTATATTRVLEDVKKMLSIPKAILFKASFNRPNLFYEVRPKSSNQKECFEQIYSLIDKRFRSQSGIVYCFSRNDTQAMTEYLRTKGVQAGCYHGDMVAKERSYVHRNWMNGKIQVVVATIAFGMGIDKPNVRFVIHQTISKSIENLYQESGRAGRDEKRSECILFFQLGDFTRQACMVFTEQTGLSNLHSILKYCIDADSCRRSIFARHFGELWDQSQCSEMCDHCCHLKLKGPSEKRDVTRHCKDVLTILDHAASVDQRLTLNKLIDAWYGKGQMKVKSVPPLKINRVTAERILAHMIITKYVEEDFHFTAYSTICYLVPGSQAKLLRTNSTKIILNFPPKPKISQNSSSSTSDENCVKEVKKFDSVVKNLDKKVGLVPDIKNKSRFTSKKLSQISNKSTSDSLMEMSDGKQNNVGKKRKLDSKDEINHGKEESKINKIDLNFDDSDEDLFIYDRSSFRNQKNTAKNKVHNLPEKSEKASKNSLENSIVIDSDDSSSSHVS